MTRISHFAPPPGAPRILSALSRAVLVLLMTGLALTGCDGERIVAAEGPASHEEFARQLESNGLGETVMGQRWLEAAQTALSQPLEVIPPYAESGGFLAHRAGALGLIFDALDGQTLRLQFERRGDTSGRVYVELFYAREPLAEARHVRLRGLAPDESSLEVVLPYDGRYIVRLQPELLIDALYSLRLELDAAVPFPVQIDTETVGSFFGDPRDAGSRLHEGIDIFAPRNTPVVAVAAGRASTRTTPRGGNVVWLRTSKRSYYYAHLERAAFEGSREVAVGEVLGYVGNSGNAIATPTHLHFGVYRRGRGAMDPLPRLAARVFGAAPEAPEFTPRHIRTRAGKLNLRAAPDTSSNVLGQLDAGSILKASALRGDWLRVTTPGNVSGWIHTAYQGEVSTLGRWPAVAQMPLLDSLSSQARPVALVGAADELDVIGRHATHLLVRDANGEKEGWIAGPIAGPATSVLVAGSDSGADDETAAGGGSSGAFE
jgi:murein DD-endopeptidase MepM/ murein hydrolase activator NlpD/SH3-like domain-containing protein